VLDTISSIRKYLGKGKKMLVILVDNSVFTKEQKAALVKAADVLLNHRDDARLNFYTSDHPQKGAGEVLQVLSALDFLDKRKITFTQLFKLTGRYLLNDSFDAEMYYKEEKSIFKQRMDVKDREYFYTSFFKIAQKDRLLFQSALFAVFDAYRRDEYKQFNGFQDEEVLLPMLMGKTFKSVNHLGMTQKVSVGGTGTVDDV
jgi:hypothetical protein